MNTVSELESMDEPVTNVPSVDRRKKLTRAPAPQPVSEPGSILDVIERAALNPNVDIDKMRALLDMRERLIARAAETEYNKAMVAAKKAMPAVTRDRKNEQTSSKYARLETISAAIDPIINDHGFSLSFGMAECPIQNHYRVTCTIRHEGGHSAVELIDIPIDATGIKGNTNKTNTHAFGSTLTYGRRYLKTMIFDVVIKDEDDDGVAAGRRVVEEFLTAAEVADLENLAKDVGADIGKFCQFMRVPSLAEMPVSLFDDAKKCLEKKRARA
jgi:hypothetical protein